MISNIHLCHIRLIKGNGNLFIIPLPKYINHNIPKNAIIFSVLFDHWCAIKKNLRMKISSSTGEIWFAPPPKGRTYSLFIGHHLENYLCLCFRRVRFLLADYDCAVTSHPQMPLFPGFPIFFLSLIRPNHDHFEIRKSWDNASLRHTPYRQAKIILPCFQHAASAPPRL